MWVFVLFLASGTWCSVSTFDIPSEWVRTHSRNDFQRQPLVPSDLPGCLEEFQVLYGHASAFVDRVILSDARTRLVCYLSQCGLGFPGAVISLINVNQRERLTDDDELERYEAHVMFSGTNKYLANLTLMDAKGAARLESIDLTKFSMLGGGNTLFSVTDTGVTVTKMLKSDGVVGQAPFVKVFVEYANLHSVVVRWGCRTSGGVEFEDGDHTFAFPKDTIAA